MAGARILFGLHGRPTVPSRIVSIRPSAYEANSAGYAALDSEVMRQTGQRIGGFQGRYGGKTFMVGGRWRGPSCADRQITHRPNYRLRELEEAIAVVGADQRAKSRSLIFGRIERTHQRRDILARVKPHPVPVV